MGCLAALRAHRVDPSSERGLNFSEFRDRAELWKARAEYYQLRSSSPRLASSSHSTKQVSVERVDKWDQDVDYCMLTGKQQDGIPIRVVCSMWSARLRRTMYNCKREF